MKDLISNVIICALVIAGFLIMPNYYVAIIDLANAQETIMGEATLFIDKIADTRSLTDKDIENFTLGVSSTSVPISFKIYREARQVNPDPTSTTKPKHTYTTWVPTDDIYSYDDGDLVRVEIKQIGDNFYQSFAKRALNMYVPIIEFDLVRMVR